MTLEATVSLVPGESRLSSVRDLAVAFGLVGVVVGAMFLYSGSWPPMVIIESGSMMHPGDTVPYGRFGTIDPGDIILVKRVDREDVRTWADGGKERYGKPGDVLVFRPFNKTDATPIIHRAIAWVDVVEDEEGTRSYLVHWVDDQVLRFDERGIWIPELGFGERAGFTRENAFRPVASGWITKGDNPATNDRADQAAVNPRLRFTDLVQPGWVLGVGRGELPWFGLVKLTFNTQFNQANPPASWIRVGNAFAPYDLWTMLGFSLVTIVMTPVGYDVFKAWRERRDARRDAERERARERGEELPGAGEDPPEFEAVGSVGRVGSVVSER